MTHLFSPLTIREITIKNRLVVSPMCQYSSVDGYANDWHLVHVGSRAVGGAGLIIMEATAVSPEGRITPDDLGLWKDEHIQELRRINHFIESQGCVPGIQLAHAGRKASHTSPWKGGKPITEKEGGWDTFAPSGIPYKELEPVPVILDEKGIEKVINDFQSAAARAFGAGFKVLEIHAAHGYLIHQFYSPLSNNRTDSYGGNFENRIRFLLRIIDAVQQTWPPALPLFVRISATDYSSDGWTLQDSIQLSRILKERGVDVIDVSSGGNVQAKIEVKPGYQVPFAKEIKYHAAILTGAVGMINTPQLAQEILATSGADLIFMARQMIREPYFAFTAAKTLGCEIAWPPPYERGKV